MKKYKIGIMGYGFLGSSMAHVFKLHADIKIYDKHKEGFNSLEDTVNNSDFIWLCLPTPMYEDNGEIDLSIVDEALSDISSLVKPDNDKIIIIKSTIVPGTTDSFSKKYPNLNIIHNPEFLTARNNLIDAITPSRIILGGKKELVDKVYEVYKYRFGNAVKIHKTSTVQAELTKYAANCFFATKVIYANMIHDVCQAFNIDYNEVKDMILGDGRISISHMNVPGHDGKRFFGGTCFTKDINSFIFKLKELEVDTGLLEEVWRRNVEGRPEKDWEKLPGVISKRQ